MCKELKNLLYKADFLKKFGNPSDSENFFKRSLIIVEQSVSNNIPKKVFLNKICSDDFNNLLKELNDNNLLNEIKTFDGTIKVNSSPLVDLQSFGFAFEINTFYIMPYRTNVFSEKFIDICLKNNFKQRLNSPNIFEYEICK